MIVHVVTRKGNKKGINALQRTILPTGRFAAVGLPKPNPPPSYPFPISALSGILTQPSVILSLPNFGPVRCPPVTVKHRQSHLGAGDLGPALDYDNRGVSLSFDERFLVYSGQGSCFSHPGDDLPYWVHRPLNANCT